MITFNEVAKRGRGWLPLIGLNALIGSGVTIGNDTVIGANAVIEGEVIIGRGNRIGHGTIIGGAPQDVSFMEKTRSRVEIGDRNLIREFETRIAHLVRPIS